MPRRDKTNTGELNNLLNMALGGAGILGLLAVHHHRRAPARCVQSLEPELPDPLHVQCGCCDDHCEFYQEADDAIDAPPDECLVYGLVCEPCV
jgi:hypothetical protein